MGVLQFVSFAQGNAVGVYAALPDINSPAKGSGPDRRPGVRRIIGVCFLAGLLPALASAQEIHAIQGAGASSPLVGQRVTSQDNVVTALAANGFFMQTPPAREDGDPRSSQGLFVFTSSAPTVAVGDRVTVNGLVEESFGFTRLGASPVVDRLGTAPLPPAVVLAPSTDPAMPACFADPDPEIANFECLEGMRVVVPDGVVVQANQRFGSDPLAEARVVVGTVRARREVGLTWPGFAGLPASIPVWDGNPESFELDPDRLGLPNEPLRGGLRFSATGVIGYEFNDYELWPTELILGDRAKLPSPVRPARPGEIAIGTLNVRRLYDDVAGNNQQTSCTGQSTGYGDALTSAEYDRRLTKTARYVLEVMAAPDILALQEVENLKVLDDLAARIATLAPTVAYRGLLVDGNDPGGIDVGFLVREGRAVMPGARVTQLGKNLQLSFAGGCLHDRPPLLLEAVAATGKRPLAVLANHTRSLNNIGDCRNSGPDFVCRKRLEQAEDIAAIVANLQASQPGRALAVVGDLNAFPFSDGHVDVVGIIRGSARLQGDPAPDSQLAPLIDRVEPNLVDAVALLPEGERYSFVFSGSVQQLDHALLSRAAAARLSGVGFARGNADAPALDADGDAPVGVSDHDGLVVYLDGR
jgi:predicted extracellular nuclease